MISTEHFTKAEDAGLPKNPGRYLCLLQSEHSKGYYAFGSYEPKASGNNFRFEEIADPEAVVLAWLEIENPIVVSEHLTKRNNA